MAQSKVADSQLSWKYPEVVISHYLLNCILIIDRKTASIGWWWLQGAVVPEGILQ